MQMQHEEYWKRQCELDGTDWEKFKKQRDADMKREILRSGKDWRAVMEKRRKEIEMVRSSDLNVFAPLVADR